MSRANQPAFPAQWRLEGDGLSVREYFAAMAMQGWLAKNGTDNYANGHLSCATESVRWADALITELAKPVSP